MRLWSVYGTCKAVLQGHPDPIKGAMELLSGNILSWSDNSAMFIWSTDGMSKEVVESDNPQYDSYYKMIHPEKCYGSFYAKENDGGICLQHYSKPLIQWNSDECKSQFSAPTCICVWHDGFHEFLQLNFGNRMNITFDQAHQFLIGKIDESKLASFAIYN